MSRNDPTTTTRPAITNAGFDPQRMLRKARLGAYPSAEKRSKYREAELAYWRDRCGLPPDAPAEPHPDEEPASAPQGDDAAFLALDPDEQRASAHNYLTSLSDDDQATGYYLCRLAGLDPDVERAAALARQAASLERFQRRARMQARAGAKKRGAAAAPMFAEELPL